METHNNSSLTDWMRGYNLGKMEKKQFASDKHYSYTFHTEPIEEKTADLGRIVLIQNPQTQTARIFYRDNISEQVQAYAKTKLVLNSYDFGDVLRPINGCNQVLMISSSESYYRFCKDLLFNIPMKPSNKTCIRDTIKERLTRWMTNYTFNNIKYAEKTDKDVYTLSIQKPNYRTDCQLGEIIIIERQKQKRPLTTLIFHKKKIHPLLKKYAQISFREGHYITCQSKKIHNSTNYVLALITEKSCSTFFQDLKERAQIKGEHTKEIKKAMDTISKIQVLTY